MIALAALFVALIGAEIFVTRRVNRCVYNGNETELTLAFFIGWFAAAYGASYITFPLAAHLYDVRVLTFQTRPYELALLILVGDLVFYWIHRLSHEIRWLWASHVVHHTSVRLNFLASLRQGWTDLVSGVWLFWLPLSLIGFAPAHWNIYFGTLVSWQLWTHNEWMGRLGPLEWIFVTPSHHRVHHSLDPTHVDHNYGGVFIIWDRLFGTFIDEGTVPITRFGLVGSDCGERHALVIAFREWRSLFAEIARQRRFGEKLACVLRR